MVTENMDDFVYNNEEESEMAQLHSIHLHMNAVDKIRQKLSKQTQSPSLTECQDCGEDIPRARQQAVPGVSRCVFCQELHERN
jgi:phage/conjugal plasmid C-4 type zinc finger TraR family protein